MTHINLLPWREKKREKRRRYFYIKLGCSLFFSFSTLIALYMALQFQHQEQEKRNSRLQKEITRLNQNLDDYSHKKITRDNLERRLVLVNALQKQRNNSTLLLNLLSHIIPHGVVLDKVSTKGESVTLKGRSQTNGQLAHLLAKLEKSEEAHDVKIHSIISKNKNESVNEADFFANQFLATFKLAGFITPTR